MVDLMSFRNNFYGDLPFHKRFGLFKEESKFCSGMSSSRSGFDITNHSAFKNQHISVQAHKTVDSSNREGSHILRLLHEMCASVRVWEVASSMVESSTSE